MKKGVDYPAIFVCGIAHDGEGKVLFARRGPGARDEIGHWNMGAGGTLEVGETLEECLVRETVEELCTAPKNLEYLGYRELFREHDGVETHWIGFYFKMLVNPKEVKLAPGEEHDDLLWIPFHDYPSPTMTNFDETYEKFKSFF